MKPEQLMRMPVTDLLTDAETFPSTDPVSKLIGHLSEHKLSEVLVEDGTSSTYVVSVRDLLNVSNINTKLATVMHQVPRLGPNNNVSDAATLMHEYRTRSMPVYRERKFAGVVTSPSVVAKLLDSETPGKISSIMTPSPYCLDASDIVSKARDAMFRKKFDQIPVLKGRGLHGIVTAEKIVFNLMPKTDRNEKGGRESKRYDEALSVLADTDVVTNDIADSLRDVHGHMSNLGSNYSVVVGTDEVQGIVTYRDFLSVLSRKAVETSIPMYIVGLPDDPFEAETARKKFQGAVELLRRSVPDISEARAVIKMGETKSPKKKYEVKVFLIHPRDRYSYSARSFELADAFDEVNGWVKEIVQRSRPRRKDRSHNARSYPDDFRPETAPG